ncbi:MAG: phosphatase PAP2 family protein [Candidatus Saccharibacteria bacterium]
MATETINLPVIKKPWKTRTSIIVAILSVIIGGTILAISYIGASKDLGIGSFNESILQFMLSLRQPGMNGIMTTVTVAASAAAITIMVILVTIIWISYKRELWRPIVLSVSVITASILSTILKTTTMISRPAEISMVPPIETDWGFPSGHTLAIIVFLLVFGYLVCSRRSSVLSIVNWLSATVIGTAIIAISRLYLGYHWLTDIVASVGLGLLVFGVFIFIDKIVTNKFTRLQ